MQPLLMFGYATPASRCLELDENGVNLRPQEDIRHTFHRTIHLETDTTQLFCFSYKIRLQFAFC